MGNQESIGGGVFILMEPNHLQGIVIPVNFSAAHAAAENMDITGACDIGF